MTCNRRPGVFTLFIGMGISLALILAGWTGRFPSRAANGDWFAIPGGSGTACTQSMPCALGTAVEQAAEGDTLYLAGGTYTGNGTSVLALDGGLTIHGGWDGTTNVPVVVDAEANPTILDGQNVGRVIELQGEITVVLQGLTVTNGHVEGDPKAWGAGLYAQGTKLTLKDVTFRHNQLIAEEYGYGGGAYIEGGTLEAIDCAFVENDVRTGRQGMGGGLAISATMSAALINCSLQSNDAWQASGCYFTGPWGTRDASLVVTNSRFVDNGRGQAPGGGYGGYAGALLARYGDVEISDSIFTHNQVVNDWGAVGFMGVRLRMERNVIRNNEASRVAGVFLNSVSPVIFVNNVLAANWSTRPAFTAGALFLQRSSGEFLHNTIASNRGAYGVLLQSGSEATLINNIVVSHTVGVSVTSGSQVEISHTLWGDGIWANGLDWGGPGSLIVDSPNIMAEPGFVDAMNGDYHLHAESAAIDAGQRINVNDDLDRDLRPLDGDGDDSAIHDIGADEYGSPRGFVYCPWIGRDAE